MAENTKLHKIRGVRFWCQKVLPLVYDDSLSYYEVLCGIRHKLNELIEQYNAMTDVIESIQEAIDKINEWIDNFDTSIIESIVRDYLATMIFVSISDAGYIVYTIPESWKNITFNTTGLDIELELQPEYGHLVLSY